MPRMATADGNTSARDIPSLFADVIVPRRLHQPFTYIVPPALQSSLTVGQRVLVPFGAASVPAVVIALRHTPPSDARAKQLKELHPLESTDVDLQLSPQQLELSRWLSERYLAPWGQCVQLVMSPGGRMARRHVKWFITEAGRQSLMASPPTLPPEERTMLQRLARHPNGLTWQTLQRPNGASSRRTGRALIRRGFIVEGESPASPASRAKHAPELPPPSLAIDRSRFEWPLDSPQKAWLASLSQVLDSGQTHIVLLQASREERRQALIAAVHEATERNRRVLILAPEAARAAEIAEVLRHAGIQRVVLLHAYLPIGQRTLAWEAVHADSVSVIVGTRSAVCAPVRGLGLLWLEDEENSAFKEEQVPRYHAREVARMRAGIEKAVLVLGSAHPSMESLYAAQTGQTTLWSIPSLSSGTAVEIVDLRHHAPGTVLSPPAIAHIRDMLAKGDLSILYVNRKGYASLLLCRACGQAPSCPACKVALRFHKRGASLSCHYCGYRIMVPDFCSACHAPQLTPIGAGTERMADVLRQHFPQIRIGRIDRDVIGRNVRADAVLAQARAGALDILIGTQMLFAQPQIPPAGLVIAMYPDGGLHLPDFRSAEHTYHALQEAMALARTDANGRFIIQTYLPHHHVIQALSRHDSSIFTGPELAYRQMLQYPPFSHLIRLDVSGESESSVRLIADRWADALRHAFDQTLRTADRPPSMDLHAATRTISILGPVPAPVPRVRRHYHWQLIVKSGSLEEGLSAVRSTLGTMDQEPRSGGVKLTVDVDPLTML